MTERKPAGMGFETWIDKQIREAADRGAFDNLPGAGKPISGHGEPDDELWWVKQYLRREGLSTEVLLPTPLRLRRQIELLPQSVQGLRTEQEVREMVSKLNLRIVDCVRAPSGPPVLLFPVNADDVVLQWRATRPAATEPGTGAVPNDEQAPHRARWWRRRTLGRAR